RVESVKGVEEGDFVIPVCYRCAGMGFPQEMWRQPGAFPIVGRSSKEAGGGLGGQADALHRVSHAEGVVHVRAWGATGCIVLEFLNSHDSFVELSKSRRFYCPLHHFRDHPSINAKPCCLLPHFSTLHSPVSDLQLDGISKDFLSNLCNSFCPKFLMSNLTTCGGNTGWSLWKASQRSFMSRRTLMQQMGMVWQHTRPLRQRLPKPMRRVNPDSSLPRLLKHRNEGSCQGKNNYNYNAFIAAAKAFNGFGTTGDATAQKRELTAFFAQTSHETTDGWATAPDGPYAWGYCFLRENSGGDYYNSQQAPCASGKNYNYIAAGKAIGFDGLNDPDIVSRDNTISFKTAIWFWMTAQSPKPSCHDVITGRWSPSGSDSAAGRVAGYGMTTNIINGGLECGKGFNAK
ncbi:hypothetical protein KI387_006860, partial [Taxus chinensis]